MKNRVVLVTGGAAGIGKATAARFAEAGNKVVICDVNQEAGEAAARSLGPDALFYKVDVADHEAVQAWVDTVVAKLGRIDILINNAGITRDGQLVKMVEGKLVKRMSDEDFDKVLAVNLKGTFNCTESVVPYMIKQGGGVILNASSIVGLYGNFGQTNYAATKAGVIAMTHVWARELSKSNIRVNAVAPGFTATEMVLKMPEKVLEMLKGRIPMGRLADPRDIASAYYFLASEEASYITGAVLSVDGGQVLGT